MIDRFFFYFTLSIILPDIYIFRKFIKPLIKSWVRYLYFIPTIVFLIGLFLLRYGDRQVIANHDITVGWFSFICFLFTLPKVLYTIFSLLDIGLKRLFQWRFTGFDILSFLLPAISILVLLYGCAIGRNKFQIKEVKYASAKIPPAFDGYRIVQLSDLHVGSWKGNPHKVEEVVQLTNNLQPDLIVFTGDIVNRRSTELEEFTHILRNLRAKDGVYSTLGNHDYGYYYPWNESREREQDLQRLKDQQASMGWILLNNAHTYLHRGNDSIALIGVENWGKPPFEGVGDLKEAMEGVNDADFKIALTHNPDHWHADIVPNSDVDLSLAGHTHALQFELGAFSPAKWVYEEWGGMYRKENQSLYVNVGTGYIGYPFRFGAWPEITLITLRR